MDGGPQRQNFPADQDVYPARVGIDSMSYSGGAVNTGKMMNSEVQFFGQQPGMQTSYDGLTHVNTLPQGLPLNTSSYGSSSVNPQHAMSNVSLPQVPRSQLGLQLYPVPSGCFLLPQPDGTNLLLQRSNDGRFFPIASSVVTAISHDPSVQANMGQVLTRADSSSGALSVNANAGAAGFSVAGAQFRYGNWAESSGMNNTSEPHKKAHVQHSSIFRGVSKCGRQNEKWQVRIRQGNSIRYLGRFTSQVEAALVYDDAARSTKGPNSQTNFIPLSIEQRRELISKTALNGNKIPDHLKPWMSESSINAEIDNLAVQKNPVAQYEIEQFRRLLKRRNVSN